MNAQHNTDLEEQVAASIAAPESTPWLDAAQAYADVMLTQGRGRWGDPPSPLFASILRRNDYELLRENDAPNLSAYGIRCNDRTYCSANVAVDGGLYELLYALSEVTGDARYGQAADEALKWFLENCRSKRTNLLPWGEHLGWELRENRVYWLRFDYHELEHDWSLWDRLFALAPAAAIAYAEGMWDHGITDHENVLFSRHTRFDHGAFEVGYEFPRYYGHFVLIWAHAISHTDDDALLKKLEEACRRVLQAALDRRHPLTGAVPAGWGQGFENSRNTYWPGNNLTMATELQEALPMLPESLAAMARELIASVDEVIFKQNNELRQDGGWMVRGALDTLQPGDVRWGGTRRQRPYMSTLWGAAYGTSTTSALALQMASRYEHSRDRRYAKLVTDAAKLYLVHEPDAAAVLHPQALANAIDLMLIAHRITGDASFIERAEYFARIAKELFLDDASHLPRVLSRQYDHYESISGGPDLMRSLLDLHQALRSGSGTDR